MWLLMLIFTKEHGRLCYGLVGLADGCRDAGWSSCHQDESVAGLRRLVAGDDLVRLGLLFHRLGAYPRGSLGSHRIWNTVQLKLGSAGLHSLTGRGQSRA